MNIDNLTPSASNDGFDGFIMALITVEDDGKINFIRLMNNPKPWLYDEFIEVFDDLGDIKIKSPPGIYITKFIIQLHEDYDGFYDSEFNIEAGSMKLISSFDELINNYNNTQSTQENTNE